MSLRGVDRRPQSERATAQAAQSVRRTLEAAAAANARFHAQSPAPIGQKVGHEKGVDIVTVSSLFEAMVGPYAVDGRTGPSLQYEDYVRVRGLFFRNLLIVDGSNLFYQDRGQSLFKVEQLQQGRKIGPDGRPREPKDIIGEATERHGKGNVVMVMSKQTFDYQFLRDTDRVRDILRPLQRLGTLLFVVTINVHNCDGSTSPGCIVRQYDSGTKKTLCQFRAENGDLIGTPSHSNCEYDDVLMNMLASYAGQGRRRVPIISDEGPRIYKSQAQVETVFESLMRLGQSIDIELHSAPYDGPYRH
mgnify:CR=1 FL=1